MRRFRATPVATAPAFRQTIQMPTIAPGAASRAGDSGWIDITRNTDFLLASAYDGDKPSGSGNLFYYYVVPAGFMVSRIIAQGSVQLEVPGDWDPATKVSLFAFDYPGTSVVDGSVDYIDAPLASGDEVAFDVQADVVLTGDPRTDSHVFELQIATVFGFVGAPPGTWRYEVERVSILVQRVP